MIKTNLIIISFIFMLFEVSASDLNVAYNPAWPSLKKMVNEKSKKESDRIIQKKINFSSFEMDSLVASKLVNLQVDAAILPIDQYHRIYDYKGSLSRFVIRSIILEEPVGILSKSGCEKSKSKLVVDPNSSEYHWFEKSFSGKKPIIIKRNTYSAIHQLDSEKVDCNETFLGSERLLEKLNNKSSIKFNKLGSLSLILLVEDHFMRSRKEEISELISMLNSNQVNQSPEKIRQEIIKYNFSERKSDWRNLDEFIKVE